MKPYIVCIDGLIGAGKSTLMQQLATDYSCFPEPISEWNLLPLLYENPRLYAFPFQIQVLISQFKQKLEFPNGLVLVERCPQTSRNVFASVLMNEKELELYDAIYKKLSYEVDLFIYLEVDPSEAFRRIQSRDNKNITLEYLQILYDRYQFVLPNDALIVNTMKSKFDVEREVRDILSKLAQ